MAPGADDWAALALTLELALVSTILLLLLGVPLAWFLAHTRSRWRIPLQVLVASPLVLPPTVLGFYLLIAFAPTHPPGSWWNAVFGTPLAFSFSGLVAGSLVYSLPFVVQPVQAAFARQQAIYVEAAATLGLAPLTSFVRISLPLARDGIIAGSCLGFAHTLGEFGVVLMIGGNLPGETRVASIAIYEHVESLNYAAAHQLSLALVLLAAVLLAVVYSLRPMRADAWTR